MLKQLQIRTAVVEYDAEATQSTYEQVNGSVNACECALCQHYLGAREKVYPDSFRQLLATLGIDYWKEIELTHLSIETESSH
jgi:hypothetical protein